uniref:C2H2-type domain-containing protein n=1 Tax=Rousettus aegyptiacus TaxID=9407 RepID=A0A7J8H0Q8_ROUAE|nr:hypothetical protein HJG63_011282 [Rousettus aegyptiacus]
MFMFGMVYIKFHLNIFMFTMIYIKLHLKLYVEEGLSQVSFEYLYVMLRMVYVVPFEYLHVHDGQSQVPFIKYKYKCLFISNGLRESSSRLKDFLPQASRGHSRKGLTQSPCFCCPDQFSLSPHYVEHQRPHSAHYLSCHSRSHSFG